MLSFHFNVQWLLAQVKLMNYAKLCLTMVYVNVSTSFSRIVWACPVFLIEVVFVDLILGEWVTEDFSIPPSGLHSSGFYMV